MVFIIISLMTIEIEHTSICIDHLNIQYDELPTEVFYF